MTDTDTAGPSLSVDPQMLIDMRAEIDKLDEQLDAASGSEVAGMRALKNSLATDNEGVWKELADKVKESLHKIEETQDYSVLVGVYSGIITSLNDEFKTKVDEYATTEANARKSQQTEVPAEKIKEMNDERKVLVEQFKALKGILKMFKFDVDDIKDPKKRTGARGKRGPRVLQNYDFYIDGQPRTRSQNSLSSIANVVCEPLGWKTPDLRNFIEEQEWDGEKISLENPPTEFEVRLPDPVNKTLRAQFAPPQREEDEDDSEELDDEENGDEENGETEDDE